eukprot:gene619-1045_t
MSQHASCTNAAERRRRRLQRAPVSSRESDSVKVNHSQQYGGEEDEKFAKHMLKNEDELLNFVANIDDLYQNRLGKPAPFMTFILIGMQSSGKSTVVERFLKMCINVVKEGTGTRCPLDITCIHDADKIAPVCDLSGKELRCGARKNLQVQEVFELVTQHNAYLGDEGKFSSEALNLVFRSKAVQNMRFVDLPGIISNASVGVDNREEIKQILNCELSKPNTKMCVLLEPKEFATNPIVDFIDSSLEGRENWVHKATFLMTKFDMRLGDSRSGSKANAFFKEFKDNGVVPFMVITPTLPSESLPPDELFSERQKLLDTADQEEMGRFREWLAEHRNFLQTHPNDEELHSEYKDKIGFVKGVQHLRGILLDDTARRLPEVLQEIRSELASCETEYRMLTEGQRYHDPVALRLIVSDILHQVQRRIVEYLDGSLEIALKLPEHLQTLEDELNEEDNSDWADRKLNHFSDGDSEERWREHISTMVEWPEQAQPNERFLGGKQYQRALAFFQAVLIDHLPEPHGLKEFVPMATGYLAGGLQRENWERALAKKYLREESKSRATMKKEFLSEQRTAMITSDETNEILMTSFQYITALMEFNLVTLKFQFNHYLYEGFKEKLRVYFGSKLMMEEKWDELIEPDLAAAERMTELELMIQGLRESMQEVNRMQRLLQ